ncbi:MAG: putative electron transfer flavoprotein FixA [Oscillospiraceae bacterium]|nr:putative electron transfer flavoprotein FixA [Oscillospiraceae bacterium]
MKIVVCYKLVPSAESLTVKSGRQLDFGSAEWEIGPYDLNAVEAAARLKEASADNSLIALTFGGDIIENSKLRKGILSRGPQELVAVKAADAGQADGYRTAAILAEAIRKIGDVDLVLFGEGSGDMYAQQTGVLVGALLGWTTVNAVNSIREADGLLEVGRNLEDSVELLELSLPAAVSVSSDICVPRLASMKDILAAGKKPFAVWSAEEVCVQAENKTVVDSVLAPEQTERACIVKPADDEAHIEAVVNQLRNFI